MVDPALALLEGLGRDEVSRCLLDNDEGTGNEPPAVMRRRKRLLRKALPVRRIGKNERERADWMRRSELGCVAAEHAGHPTDPERCDIRADQRAGCGVLVDEQGKSRTTRER